MRPRMGQPDRDGTLYHTPAGTRKPMGRKVRARRLFQPQHILHVVQSRLGRHGEPGRNQ